MDGWDLFTETAEAGEVAKLCIQLIVLEAAAKQSFPTEKEKHLEHKGHICIAQGYHPVAEAPGQSILSLLL